MSGSGANAPALLSVSGVVMRFGGIVALAGVSFEVGRREICGLIGPNGSGKTTLFNCISGIYRHSRGEIRFEGRSLAGLARHQMAGLGIGRTFQNVALFNTMTVRDNMLVGAHHLGRSGFVANALKLAGARRVAIIVIGRHVNPDDPRSAHLIAALPTAPARPTPRG